MTELASKPGYLARRDRIEAYFDRTAADTWVRLTSDAPVSRIRETVRKGRDAMRELLLSWLPQDMSGRRLLDAGCGTGALAIAAAQRGAAVVGVDISENLIAVARDRAGPLPVAFHAGDMLDPALGRFDHAVLMDSLIHYEGEDAVAALGRLAERVTTSIAFTFAPRTVALSAMHAAGRLFPRADRAPAIVPLSERALVRQLSCAPALAGWRIGRTQRIVSGFYLAQAMELRR